MLSARAMSRVKTEAARPHSTPFAHAIAWSSSAKRCRAEHLTLDDLVLLSDVDDHRWLDEEAALPVSAAALMLGLTLVQLSSLI